MLCCDPEEQPAVQQQQEALRLWSPRLCKAPTPLLTPPSQVRRSASGHLYADKAEISKCDMIATNGELDESSLKTLTFLSGVAHQLDSFLLPSERAVSAQVPACHLIPFNLPRGGPMRLSRTSSTSTHSAFSKDPLTFVNLCIVTFKLYYFPVYRLPYRYLCPST